MEVTHIAVPFPGYATLQNAPRTCRVAVCCDYGRRLAVPCTIVNSFAGHFYLSTAQFLRGSCRSPLHQFASKPGCAVTSNSYSCRHIIDPRSLVVTISTHSSFVVDATSEKQSGQRETARSLKLLGLLVSSLVKLLLHRVCSPL